MPAALAFDKLINIIKTSSKASDVVAAAKLAMEILPNDIDNYDNKDGMDALRKAIAEAPTLGEVTSDTEEITIMTLSNLPMSPGPVADQDLLYIVRTAFPEGIQSESISVENLRIAMGGNPKLNQVVRSRYGTLDTLLSGVTADIIVDGQIVTQKLANGAVTGPKIASGAITRGKIAPGAVTSAKLDSTVTELIITTVESAIDALPASELPALPSAGSRDNKIAKFDGDVLGWEADAGGSSSGLNEAAVDARIVAKVEDWAENW